jgi:acetyl-CoA carboxylase carboxyl transferase subunit alpha
MMRHADHHGFPILTFIDTPGAYAGIKAEELGQGEAIAVNLREMFGLRVPIITTVIGEGGSGGALAIGCCDKMLMLENAVYYVASPEACAAILWKTAAAAPLVGFTHQI